MKIIPFGHFPEPSEEALGAAATGALVAATLTAAAGGARRAEVEA
jgi:hypothetical protein